MANAVSGSFVISFPRWLLHVVPDNYCKTNIASYTLLLATCSRLLMPMQASQAIGLCIYSFRNRMTDRKYYAQGQHGQYFDKYL